MCILPINTFGGRGAIDPEVVLIVRIGFGRGSFDAGVKGARVDARPVIEVISIVETACLFLNIARCAESIESTHSKHLGSRQGPTPTVPTLFPKHHFPPSDFRANRAVLCAKGPVCVHAG